MCLRCDFYSLFKHRASIVARETKVSRIQLKTDTRWYQHTVQLTFVSFWLVYVKNKELTKAIKVWLVYVKNKELRKAIKVGNYCKQIIKVWNYCKQISYLIYNMSKSMPATLKSSIYCPKRTPWTSICLLFYIYVNMYIT